MKKTIAIMLALAAICCSSCKKNELFFYDEEYSALNIWFGTENVISDSLTYNFAYTVAERDSIMFRVRLTGMPADHDRTFHLKATEGDIASVEFENTEYVLKAGQYEGVYPLYIHKPDGYSEFTTTAGHLRFELEENSDFLPGANESRSLNLVLRNALVKPDDWDEATMPIMPLKNYFGTYSDVKYAFIIQTTGYSNFHVHYSMSAEGLADDEITHIFADYLKQKCKAALVEYEETHGEPLVDEFGFLVEFP